ncbi:MAG: terminase large subunit [Siphoviridae sp. ctCJE6]|nr:MAG: terminase large subunit [Siphoviridae sp. ctCJE6]
MSSAVFSARQKKVFKERLIPDIKRVLARRDANDFCEYVVKDEKGNKISQAEIHREINWHIDECRRLGLNCGILAPWRHGKTEQVVVGRTLKFLGEDPNNRIFIICNSDDNAKARVGSVSRYIERDEEYHDVFPHVVPGPGADWGKHKLIVKRPSLSKDGSVEAWGITSSGTGAGCDFLIADDPVDLRNAILNPALRDQVKDSFNNVWCSRLSPGGFKIYIATAWHDNDLTSDLRKNKEWCFLIIKVSADFSCMECESPLKGKFTIPLWDMWPKEKLLKRYSEIGQRAFNRGYRQEALSDEDRTFPSSDKIFNLKVGHDVVPRDWPKVIGMDPFGKKVVIFVLAYNPVNCQKIPVDIRIGKWSPKKSIEELKAAYQEWAAQLAVVENNAAQQAIVQWAQEIGGHRMLIVPFTTGSQKANPAMGLPSLEVEFANGGWMVPMRDVREDDAQNPFNVWKAELAAHPVGEAEDTVMASWFAREGVRYMTQYEAPDDQTIHQEEIIPEVEPVKIGDY